MKYANEIFMAAPQGAIRHSQRFNLFLSLALILHCIYTVENKQTESKHQGQELSISALASGRVRPGLICYGRKRKESAPPKSWEI